MPEPISTVALLVSAGLGAYSAITTASAQSRAEEANAAAAEASAKQEDAEASFNAERIRSRNRRALAAQKAAQGASGAAISGTALDVRTDSATQGELDALAALYEGETRRVSLLQESQASRQAARDARRQGILGAAGSALSGAARAASSFQSFRDRREARRASLIKQNG